MTETILIILLGAAALLVRLGQALHATGTVRSKNAAGAVLRSVTDLCVATIAFWAIGAAIMSQPYNAVFAIDARHLVGLGSRGGSDSLFSHLVPVLIASGIVAGAIQERGRFAMVAVASTLMAALVVPIAGHWVWYGWLERLGVLDAAGAIPVHVAGGACALVAAALVGPRNGKYNRDGSSNMIPGHNVPLIGAGAVVTLVAWVPYVVAGAWAAAKPLDGVAMNVMLAAAAGAGVSLLVGRVRYGKPDVLLTLSGMTGGLVSITAAAASVSSLSAFAIGAIAGLLVPAATLLIDVRMKIDDPSGNIAVHGIGGAWGALAAALFVPLDLASRARLLSVQALGIVAIAALAVVLAVVAFGALRVLGGLRPAEADEFDGLDLAEHDINAYPDFQQTMIKSYHLREA